MRQRDLLRFGAKLIAFRGESFGSAGNMRAISGIIQRSVAAPLLWFLAIYSTLFRHDA